MSTEENKALVRRLIEGVWNTGNYGELAEIAGPTFAESTERVNRDLRQSLPDSHQEILDLIAEGDRVVARWSCSGTHNGDWTSAAGTVAPTGKRVNFTGIHIFRIADGKIVERSAEVNLLDVLQQMDALPKPS